MCIKLYIFGILMIRQKFKHSFQRNRSMFQFLIHVELSRSMAAILEMPQYVAHQKNVAYAFIKLSAKSHSFNIFCTMDMPAALLLMRFLIARLPLNWNCGVNMTSCLLIVTLLVPRYYRVIRRLVSNFRILLSNFQTYIFAYLNILVYC